MCAAIVYIPRLNTSMIKRKKKDTPEPSLLVVLANLDQQAIMRKIEASTYPRLTLVISFNDKQSMCSTGHRAS